MCTIPKQRPLEISLSASLCLLFSSVSSVTAVSATKRRTHYLPLMLVYQLAVRYLHGTFFNSPGEGSCYLSGSGGTLKDCFKVKCNECINVTTKYEIYIEVIFVFRSLKRKIFNCLVGTVVA